MNATLIVLATGRAGHEIGDFAQRHAELDPDSRRVLRPGDAKYPHGQELDRWSRAGAAALMVDADGRVCALLDARQALSAPWIEDAFVRARN